MAEADGYGADEMMTVAAARALRNGTVCFVGIGLPSAAANLARATHAPGVVLIYESGTIDTKPTVLPLSIGDGELAETALTVVPLPEIFNYWLQGSRIDVGFLGAAQLNRFGNINTTVVGRYGRPRVRLPGAGGASEVANSCREVIVVLRHNRRAFVNRVDFVTSAGYLSGDDERAKLGLPGNGPVLVITDLGLLTPDPETKELVLTSVHPGVDAEQVKRETGWPLRVAQPLGTTHPPTEAELGALRALEARTRAARRGAPR